MTGLSVIGAGAWGTALAQQAASKGQTVTLWARDQAQADTINADKENKTYLPGIPLNGNISAVSDYESALKSNILLMVTPAQALRAILEEMKPHIRTDHVFVLCSKGIEQDTGLLMSEVAQAVLPNTPLAVLTGPNFAQDIAQGKPAGTTLACIDEALAKTIQSRIGSNHFRPYITNDVIGAQLAGALKNVIAIACGMAQGLDMGESARASLVTRGLAEIARLGVPMGAQPETLLGLCGVGDMMLTCSSTQSRNFSLGAELGQGNGINDILRSRKTVTEGVHTAKSAKILTEKYEADMPICNAVYKCLHEGLSIDAAFQEMLNRPLGHE